MTASSAATNAPPCPGDDGFPQREENQSFLLKLSDSLRSLDDAVKIQAEACKVLGTRLEAARVLYIENDGGEFSMPGAQYTDGVPPLEGPLRMASFDATLADKYRLGRTVVQPDVAGDPALTDEQKEVFARHQIGAFLAVPMEKSGGCIARLGVHHRTAHRWTEEEVALVKVTADRLWAALERARAQTELRKSEERLRAFVMASSTATYRMNADWSRILSFDGNGFLQAAPEAGTAWLASYIHPDDQPQISEAIQHAVTTRQMFELEHRVRRADGTWGWTLSRAVPLFDADGNITEWFGAASDVTSRKNTEEALRRNDERQAFLLKLSDALRTVADPHKIKELAMRLLGMHLRLSNAGYAEVEADGDTLWAGGEYEDGKGPEIKGRFRLSDFGSGVSERLRAGFELFSRDISNDPRRRAPGQPEGLAAKPLKRRAVAALPLVKNNSLVACLYAVHAEPHEWADAERQLLRDVAERTWAAVERARAEEAVAADLRDTQLLQDLGARFVSEPEDIQDLYDQINEAARRLTRADAGTVQILDQRTQELAMLSCHGFPGDALERFGVVGAASTTSCGIALRAGKRIFVDFDNPELEDASGDLRWHVGAGYLSAQSTPLITRSGEAIGMVSTHWHEHRRPTERELRFLDLLARQAADLIGQWQSQHALRVSEERLAADLADMRQLHLVSSQLLRENNPQTLYKEIVDAAVGMMRSQAASLQGMNYETQKLQLLAWRGFHPESAEFWRVVSCGSSSACGQALQNSGRIVVPDVEGWDMAAGTEDHRHYRLSNLRSVQSTPLISRSGRLVGVLSTHWREPYDPSERELRLMDVLARQAADLIERNMAGEALRESEEKYRSLFESIDEGFCLVEVLFDESHRAVDYRFIEANPAFVKLTGLENVPGRRMRELAPDHDDRWFEVYGRIALTGSPERFELPAEALGRFYDVYAFRVGGPDQHRVAVLFDDITGRKLTEDMLRQEADLDAFRVTLTDALRSLTDPAAVQAAAMRVLGVHLQASRTMYVEVEQTAEGEHHLVRHEYCAPGVSALPGRFRGQDFGAALFDEMRAGHTVVVPDLPAEPRLALAEREGCAAACINACVCVPLLKEGSQAAYVAVQQDHPRLWTQAEVALVEETAERAWGAVESSRYVLAQREGEAKQAFLLSLSDAIRALRDSARIMETAVTMLGVQLQATQVGYGETDNGESYLDVLMDWTQPGRESFLGQHPPLSHDGEDIRCYQAGLPWIVEDAENDHRQVVRAVAQNYIQAGARAVLNIPLCKEGRWVAMLYATSAEARRWTAAETDLVREVAERTWAALELARAQQALQEAKEAAETANRSKDHFLAVLSHELRTPLTPVLMTVDALQHDSSLSQSVLEDLAMMKRNIQLETKLIDDLLDISRITSGKLALHVAAVDLNDLVRNVCRICGQLIRERGIELQTRLDRTAGVINADSSRLQQVLWNVLMNAIKFTPARGSIHVSTAWLTGGRCEVRIQDSGAGIDAEVLPHIFNAFEQGGAGVTRQFGGLGLGLAITKAIVELHHGTIRGESPGTGQGATFVIELPGRAMTATAKIRLAAPAVKEKMAGLRLLVVEDHADTARTLALLLRREGFTVVTASNVESAVATAKSGGFDLLVSDLGLPDGTGYDVMRSVHSILGIPGVAMSGFGMEEDLRRSQEAGFAEHLVKPIDVAELIAAIRRVAARKISGS